MRIPGVAAAVVFLGALPALARADTLKAPSEDYPTIQSAIDDAMLYDTVIILAGDHDESPVVNGRSYLKIKAKKGTTLNGFTVQNSDYIALSGFTVSGGATGVTVVDCSDVLVSKVEVLSTTGSGIYLEDCSRVSISKALVSGAGGHGIQDDAGEDIVVSKCTITNCGNDGIHMSTDNVSPNGSDRAVVTGNRIAGCLNGITAGGDDLVIEKNRMDGISTRGIHVKASSDTDNALIEKNRIVSEEIVITAIEFAGGSSRVNKNVIEGGRILESGSSNDIHKNRISGSNIGIIASGTFVLVSWNTVRDGITGIQVYATFADVWGNKVFDVVSGIEFYGADPFTTGNRVVRASAIGFYVAVSSGTFFHDVCKGSGVADLADVNAEFVNSYTSCRFGVIVFNFVD